MIVAVYGSAAPKPGSPLYQNALELGRLLAQADYTVMTGGYGGTMEAVSRGASEASGTTLGVTCAEIEQYRPGGANPWVAGDTHSNFTAALRGTHTPAGCHDRAARRHRHAV